MGRWRNLLRLRSDVATIPVSNTEFFRRIFLHFVTGRDNSRRLRRTNLFAFETKSVLMTPTSLPIVQSRRKRLGLAVLVLCFAVAGGYLWSVKRARPLGESPTSVISQAPSSQDLGRKSSTARDTTGAISPVLRPLPTALQTAVPVPGHFEGIMVINQPEPPLPPVPAGTPRTPGKIYPNPPEIGGFVVETDETWAVETKAPPLR